MIDNEMSNSTLDELEEMAESLDRDIRSDKVSEQLLDQYQARLYKITKTSSGRKSVGPSTYIAYELQGLIFLARSDSESARIFFTDAVTRKGDEQLFTKVAKDAIRTGSVLKKYNKLTGISHIVINIIVTLLFIGLGRAFPTPTLIIAAITFASLLVFSIIKYHKVEARDSDARNPKNGIIGYSVWFMLTMVVLGYQVWADNGDRTSGTHSSYETPSELASRVVQEVKASTTFPLEVDEVTTFNDISSYGSTVLYQYVIHDADITTISNEDLRSTIQPTVCSNASTVRILNRGVSLQYSYSDQNTGQKLSFTIAQSNC